MSQHHHHHNKEHPHHEAPPYKIHHDWRFYAAGFLIMLALVAYLLSEDLAFRPSVPPPANVSGK